MKRYAIVRGASSRREAERYLPDNYSIIHEYAVDDVTPSKNHGPDARPNTFVIAGKDEAGWTLDGYVIPRYASGLIGCVEVDLSHDVFKSIPQTPKHARSLHGGDYVIDDEGRARDPYTNDELSL